MNADVLKGPTPKRERPYISQQTHGEVFGNKNHRLQNAWKKRMRDICDRSQHWHPSLMCKNKILSTFQSITFAPPTQDPPVNPPSRQSHSPAP